MPDVRSFPKQPKPAVNKGGRARPDEPLGQCEYEWTIDCEQKRCTQPAVHRHHKLRRSHGQDDSPENTVDLCQRHDNFVHANPTWSYAHGYLIRGVR